MHSSFRKLVLMAAVASVSVSGQAFAAYTLTTAVAGPFTSTANPGSGASTTYTTLALNATSTTAMPNGAYISNVIGTVTGKTNDANAATVNTAFIYDAVRGFRLIGMYTPTSTGGHSNTQVRGVNASGQVIGASNINSTQSTDVNGILGVNAWLYSSVDNSTVQLGLTGPNFSYTRTVPVNGTVTPVAFNGTFRSSTPTVINAVGQVVGTSLRYAGDATTSPNTGLGTSTWIYNAGLTTEIGLFGANNSYNATTGATLGRFSSNTIQGLNAVGTVIGQAAAYYDTGAGTATSLGQDGWTYNGVTTTAIGLYQNGVDPTVQNFSGFKYYRTVANTGTTPVSSQFRSTTINGVNSTGQTIGYSNYFSGTTQTGQDAFVYSPATGNYRQVGFYNNTGNFSASTTPVAGISSFVSTGGVRSSSASFINDSGKVVGTSSLSGYYYNTTFSTVSAVGSSVAWIDDGTGATTRIGLYGQAADPQPSVHVNPQTTATSTTLTNLTQSGLVGGYSARYFLNATNNLGTTLGQDAFVYDSNIGATYLLDPIDAAGSNYTASSILYLSEDGYAVGQYAVSTSTSSSGSFNKGFLWSLAGGFVDLGTNVSPTLSASGYQNLIAAYFSSTAGGTIYATASSTGSNTTVNALLALTVPEPTSMAALACFGVGLLRRRVRCSN